MSIRKRNSKKAKNGYVYEVYFTYKHNGMTQRYSKSGFLSKKEAQEHEALKKAELKETGKIHKEVKKTFKEVYEEFLEVGADQYQENTIHNTQIYYRYCEVELAKIPIINFDYPLLQKYFNSRKNKGLETNKGIKKAINRVLNYALKAGYIKSNPLNLVTVKGVEKHIDRDEVLNYEDFLKIIDALENKNNFRKKAYSIALQIGYYTGLRTSEVFALEKNDILLQDDLIFVNKKMVYKGLKKDEIYVVNKMKSKKSKAIIPLARSLKDVLIKWFEVNPYEKVICDIEGNYIHPEVMSSFLRELSKKLNVSYHFHMLRHTFATNLVTNDVDLKTTQELMRHSNINTTMDIYTHIKDEHKITVVNDVFKTKCVENVSKDEIGTSTKHLIN